MDSEATQQSDAIGRFGLEQYVHELESDGITIVPPEVTGVAPDLLDQCTEALLKRFTELTGCPITVEEGPQRELAWPDPETKLGRKNPGPPEQILIQQLLQLDRCFRDLALNPVVDALIDYLIGPVSHSAPASLFAGGARARRLSSTNAFVKWKGQYGYGENLGLHSDQIDCAVPPELPGSLNANANWVLTDYTRESGALAYVPSSHKPGGAPTPTAVQDAVPVVAARGSVIVFGGRVWHGAYPRQLPGLRLAVSMYFRHLCILPQENLHATLADQRLQDCDNPERMRELIGLDDPFPYRTPFPVPKLATPS